MAEHSAPIAENRKVRFHYDLLEFLEAGISLIGPEVKSLRAGKVSFADGYVDIRQGEAWLVGVTIAPYDHAGYVRQVPDRPRKLLLHAGEISMLFNRVTQKGLTVVPIRMYLKAGKVKVEIALARGRTAGDRRNVLKERAETRDMEREMAERRRG